MDLIVETGVGVPNANTYITAAEAVTFAADRGVTLPAENATKVLIVKSMDWLESLADRYQGLRTSSTQSLQWPRTGVTLYGADFAPAGIPDALKRAQSQVVMDLFSGIDPQTNFTATPGVIKEKVDVLEITYSELSQDTIPYLRKALDFLSPLFGATVPASPYFSFRY